MVLSITACGQNAKPGEHSEPIRIVATIFPQFDWTREIIGDLSDRFELTLLVGDNVDMHSFQPTVPDIAKISNADLFIYVGGHSDEWVEGVLNQVKNQDMVVINMVEELGDHILIVEHDCGDDECEDDHSHGDGESVEEEHVWTSLRLSRMLCTTIAEAIVGLDPENTDTYIANLSAYVDKLNALNARYTEMVEAANSNTVVFADRFPFLYMMNDYGIDFYAAFSGCFAAAEASFATVVQLSRKIDELELDFVMVTETGNHRIADTIIEATTAKNQKILVLDGMKTATSSMSYLSIMEKNLEVLREALS
jgi:zinc transport system substrate-binding protein